MKKKAFHTIPAKILGDISTLIIQQAFLLADLLKDLIGTDHRVYC